MRTLRRGLRGPDVKQWQSFLATEGLLRSHPDGIFGARTYAATRVFQAREGLVIDGIVGAQTVASAHDLGHLALHRHDESELESAVIETAKRLLRDHWDKPHGTLVPFSVESREYFMRLEERYNAEGSSIRPWGYYPAAAVFSTASAEDSRRVFDEERQVETSTRPMLDANSTLIGDGLVVHGQFRLSEVSRARLVGVHEALRRLVERAIEMAEIDFCVLEGIRALDRQRELCAVGASSMIDSRHLTGHAIDLAPWIGASVSWHWPYFQRLSAVVKRAASELDISVVWGGDWPDSPDGPHWELCRERYP